MRAVGRAEDLAADPAAARHHGDLFAGRHVLVARPRVHAERHRSVDRSAHALRHAHLAAGRDPDALVLLLVVADAHPHLDVEVLLARVVDERRRLEGITRGEALRERGPHHDRLLRDELRARAPAPRAGVHRDRHHAVLGGPLGQGDRSLRAPVLVRHEARRPERRRLEALAIVDARAPRLALAAVAARLRHRRRRDPRDELATEILPGERGGPRAEDAGEGVRRLVAGEAQRALVDRPERDLAPHGAPARVAHLHRDGHLGPRPRRPLDLHRHGERRGRGRHPQLGHAEAEIRGREIHVVLRRARPRTHQRHADEGVGHHLLGHAHAHDLPARADAPALDVQRALALHRDQRLGAIPRRLERELRRLPDVPRASHRRHRDRCAGRIAIRVLVGAGDVDATARGADAPALVARRDLHPVGAGARRPVGAVHGLLARSQAAPMRLLRALIAAELVAPLVAVRSLRPLPPRVPALAHEGRRDRLAVHRRAGVVDRDGGEIELLAELDPVVAALEPDLDRRRVRGERAPRRLGVSRAVGDLGLDRHPRADRRRELHARVDVEPSVAPDRRVAAGHRAAPGARARGREAEVAPALGVGALALADERPAHLPGRDGRAEEVGRRRVDADLVARVHVAGQGREIDAEGRLAELRHAEARAPEDLALAGARDLDPPLPERRRGGELEVDGGGAVARRLHLELALRGRALGREEAHREATLADGADVGVLGPGAGRPSRGLLRRAGRRRDPRTRSRSARRRPRARRGTRPIAAGPTARRGSISIAARSSPLTTRSAWVTTSGLAESGTRAIPSSSVTASARWCASESATVIAAPSTGAPSEMRVTQTIRPSRFARTVTPRSVLCTNAVCAAFCMRLGSGRNATTAIEDSRASPSRHA